MELLPKWVLNDNHPAFYDIESKTAVEQTARVYGAMQSLIKEYNSFVEQVNHVWNEYKDKNLEDNDLFQRKMEQLFNDFVKTITLKYQAQDLEIKTAINKMISELPFYLETALENMYQNGEFNDIVYNSIAGLKAEFEKSVANTTTFQVNINKMFTNLVNDMEAFKDQTSADFDSMESNLELKFDELLTLTQVADMQKSIYDTDNNGKVDDSDKLGGQIPSYYAKQQDLESINANIETMYGSISSGLTQMATMQKNVNTALTTVIETKTKTAQLETAVKNKLDSSGTANNSNSLGGQPAEYYAPLNNAINEYSHSYSNGVHNLSGNGDNIKFIATNDYTTGDIFCVNGVEVEACFQNGDTLTNGYFKSGFIVSCFLNGTKLNFKSGGAGLNPESITVYSGSDYPVSPKTNDIFIDMSNHKAKMYINREWVEIPYELLQTIIFPGETPAKRYSKGNITVLDFNVTREANSEAYAIYYIPVDVTNYKKINVVGELCGYAGMCLAKTLPNASTSGARDVVFEYNATEWSKVMASTNSTVINVNETIDVSTLNGAYYFITAIYGSNVNLPKSYVYVSSLICE